MQRPDEAQQSSDVAIGDGSVSPVICRLSAPCAPDLAEIERESNSPPWSAHLFAQEFRNPCSLVFGARHGGELVGFLVCHEIVDEAHIVNFAVAKHARSRGIGRALVEYVLRDLHVRGVRWVTLEVRKSNTVARSLYDSLGFAEVGVRAQYYPDDHEDALVMSLNINQFVDNSNGGEGGTTSSSSSAANW